MLSSTIFRFYISVEDPCDFFFLWFSFTNQKVHVRVQNSCVPRLHGLYRVYAGGRWHSFVRDAEKVCQKKKKKGFPVRVLAVFPRLRRTPITRTKQLPGEIGAFRKTARNPLSRRPFWRQPTFWILSVVFISNQIIWSVEIRDQLAQCCCRLQ